MTAVRLRRLDPADVRPLGGQTLDDATLTAAGEIVHDVRRRGEAALREHAERLGDLAPGEAALLDRGTLKARAAAVPNQTRSRLERMADRIAEFARAQRDCLHDLSVPVPGGHAGHTVAPMERAGCYAPGGRFPLPSSVLMTAVTARVAGVETVVVASPRPTPATLAAAEIAGADMLVAAGGAQAIAAMAYGAGDVPACDIVVGPGNRWVTAAKQLVAGHVAIDMLAGPSELVVLADAASDVGLVAADLLAQAEHDPDAGVVLVVLDEAIIDRVEVELAAQLADLPTAEIARQSVMNGIAVVARDEIEAAAVCDRFAPEHLALHIASFGEFKSRLRHYGALFEGSISAEVFGDYGIGPNHVLPTGGTARSMGGLSVLNFLRVRTWLRLDAGTMDREMIDDVAEIARVEGLEAHARSAQKRSGQDRG